jgi:hypothetical protein
LVRATLPGADVDAIGAAVAAFVEMSRRWNGFDRRRLHGLLRPSCLIAAGVVALVVHIAPAAATPYEAFIDIETEADLEDLLATGQITTETYGALYALLERGVDLNSAGREELYSLPNLTYTDVDAILKYRKGLGTIIDPASLSAVGALSEDKLLAIAAFIVVRTGDSARQPLHGLVRGVTRMSQDDDTIPPVALLARIRSGRHWSAGLAATLDRRQIGPVTWDPNRGGLMADAPGIGVTLPKFFVRRRTDDLDVIAGTYRVGFGQRLTFDNALDYTPNGLYSDDLVTRSYDLSRDCVESTGELSSSPCAGTRRYEYVTPDFNVSDGLRGVAGGTNAVPFGDGHLQAYGWASYQTRGVYQYEIANTGACEDPRDDGATCAAPNVFVRGDDPLAPAAELSYQTLPDIVAESLIGGNVTYFASQRDFIGVTGYGATMDWLAKTPEGVKLDFQEWSRYPTGGSFGAVGANLGVGVGLFDVFAEVTHSFDHLTASGGSVDGGGGPAAIVRATHTHKKRELELSLRYYDPNFVNPYAGATASPDEVEGQRARGEHGARLRYTAVHGEVGLRAGLDLWRSLAETPRADGRDWTYVSRGDVYVRADVAASPWARWGAWLRYQDKGLSKDGDRPCFEVLFEDGALDEPATCFGNKLTSTGRLRLTDRRLAITAQVQHEYLDDAHLMDEKRHDLSGLFIATWKPNARTGLTGRMRYLNQDIADNTYLEQSLRSSVEATRLIGASDRLRVRMDLVVYLDDRPSTEQRTPSPELWLGAEYQTKF